MKVELLNNVSNYFVNHYIKATLITLITVAALGAITYAGMYYSSSYYIEYAPMALLIGFMLCNAGSKDQSSQNQASKSKETQSIAAPVVGQSNVNTLVRGASAAPATTHITPTRPPKVLVMPRRSSTKLMTASLYLPDVRSNLLLRAYELLKEKPNEKWYVFKPGPNRPTEASSSDKMWVSCKIYDDGFSWLAVDFNDALTISEFRLEIVKAWKVHNPGAIILGSQFRILYGGCELMDAQTCGACEFSKAACITILMNRDYAVLLEAYFSPADVQTINETMDRMNSLVDRRQRGRINEVLEPGEEDLFELTEDARVAIEHIEATKNENLHDLTFLRGANQYISSLHMLRDYILTQILPFSPTKLALAVIADKTSDVIAVLIAAYCINDQRDTELFTKIHLEDISAQRSRREALEKAKQEDALKPRVGHEVDFVLGEPASPLTIYISSPRWTKSMQIETHSNATVGSVVRQLIQTRGVQYKLLLSGSPLEVGRSLASYQLNHQSVIHAARVSSPALATSS